MIHRYFILFLVFLAYHTGLAQQPVSIHLTEKDGLPDIEFYDLLEDNKGFIWLAADKGLYRYDGRNYKLFTNPDKRGRSLFGLKLDNQGRLWCNNLSGQFFYVQDEELKLFEDYGHIKTLVDFNIYDNHLIIYEPSRIVTVDISTKSITATVNSSTRSYMVDLNYNSKGFYYNKNSIICFSSTVDFQDAKTLNNSPIAAFNQRVIRKFFEWNDQIYYFNQLQTTSKTSLYQLLDGGIIEVDIPIQLQNVIVIHSYNLNNNLWILTNKGIFISQLDSDVLIVKEHIFKNQYITDLVIDKDNNYWLSTLNNGVFVLPNKQLNKINLPDNVGVQAIEKVNDDLLYIATNSNEVFSYNLKKNKFKKLPESFNNKIYNICYNPLAKDLLMVATTDSKIYNLDTKQSQSSNLIVTKSIDVLDHNQYLISLPHSLSIYNKNKDSIYNLRTLRSYGSVLNKTKSKAYCSFVDGLGWVDLKTNKYKKITHNNSPIYALKIAISHDDMVWVATDEKGLLGFKNDSLIKTINIKNGLASNLINVLVADKNVIWIATDKGLQSYNYKTKTLNTINKQDGIDSYNINAIEVVGDQVFFSSNTGLYQFNSNKINTLRSTSQPYFTNVSIQERDTIIKTSYTLKQTESEIRFGFNVNGFQTNQFVDFEYQLEGYDKNWIALDNGLNFVKFNTLPAGQFKFNVRAKNRSQNNYTNPISIALTVRLPFYKTWWFYLLFLLSSVGLVWWYYSQKTKRLNIAQFQALEKAKINQQLVFSQLENLRSQMNPHFIFNALNSIQDYIILNESKLARQYLVKFSRLIRTYLEHSQANEITLNEEIKTLRLYLELEKDRFDDDFKFEINIHQDLDLENTFVPTLFIQPYVENALKHGLLHKKNNKKLVLNFKQDINNQSLICEIIDNGIGRKASAIIKNQRQDNYKSFATFANQKRIELLNRSHNKAITLTIEDVINAKHDICGTKVVIKIQVTD